MEYLDIYDEAGNPIGREDRKTVHEKGLWHKTVHCWLYNASGEVYFQIRADEKTFYTTASGHVKAGETIEEAFGREIKEEIGLTLQYEKAEPIDVVVWKMDKEKADGSMFIDRAFANVYGYLLEEEENYHFDEDEVLGIAKVNAMDAKKLMEGKVDHIPATLVTQDHTEKKEISLFNFLVTKGETAIQKYGAILDFVIARTNENR